MNTYNHFDITVNHRVIWERLTFEQLRDRLMYKGFIKIKLNNN